MNQTIENTISVLLITVCFGLLVVMFIKFSQPISISVNGKALEQPAPYTGEVLDFIILAKRFADYHTACNGTNCTKYNCVNYTNDLKFIADKLGFKTEKVIGYPFEPNKTGHAWLRLKVDWEPQTGDFVDYSKMYPNQEVINNGNK